MKGFLLLLAAFMINASVYGAAIRGTVVDKNTQEPLIGAAIQVSGTSTGAVTDLDGCFELAGLRNGAHQLIISYISYITQTLEVEVEGVTTIQVEMESDNQQLGEVVVTAEVKRNTEMALLSQQRKGLVVQTGVSAQQITRTQDKDASEVIRRVPGISIIDGKFVMVRGLSQRYNNVWINNSAVPSSEADARAFSFDIIPSSQLDNIVVVKSASPEYPADFTGGFILVNTKDVPNQNTFGISIGGSVNDRTHFRDFLSNKRSGTDFLGFDNGLRSLEHGIFTQLKSDNNQVNNYSLLGNGFNNDWSQRKRTTLADLNMSMNFSHRWVADSGSTWAMLGVLNYSSTDRTYLNMENNLFGSYDTTNDRSNFLHRYTDNQYNHNVRLGAMWNLTYVTANGNSRYEWKNIFNQLGKDRLTNRLGYNAQSEYESQAEYYYQSRSTYNGQFTGKHTLGEADKLDWSAGYSYANRNMPDRRRYTQVMDEESHQFVIENINDANREFSHLDEHILSANVNYLHSFSLGEFNPSLKA